MAKHGALANLDVDSVIEQLSAGKLLKQIAATLNPPVTKQSLHYAVKTHPDYKDALASQAESLVEIATSECMDLDESATVTDIGRARAKIDAAHKWAAARDPARWAQRQQVDVKQSITVVLASYDAQGNEIMCNAVQQLPIPSGQYIENAAQVHDIIGNEEE